MFVKNYRIWFRKIILFENLIKIKHHGFKYQNNKSFQQNVTVLNLQIVSE